ncbi:cysteine proteinase [Piedraia hortae CBS 480.64]|uniref:ubiquitinyl hydrolase 1 n=1 Tax=Piedraia hortae CBS 480.64 TaxID=1314780 RepID=A0A6A7BYG2_9PEZI|nr:cysteine proteinase [Piedraia hortae CBS 480.64]
MPPKKRKPSSSEYTHPFTPFNFPGWIEMESEPVFFSAILHDLGVCGLKFTELYSLETDHLLPPVYALIFLCRWRQTDSPRPQDVNDDDDDDDDEGGGQNKIWFAQQTPEFACATFAVLNIVMNLQGFEFGEELERFKVFTENMGSLERVDAIDNWEFAKRIHNSFARGREVMLADAQYLHKSRMIKRQMAAEKACQTRLRKKQKAGVGEEREVKTFVKSGKPGGPASAAEPAASARRSKRTKPKPELPLEEDEGGFHFIAYMPISSEVYMLDGLHHSPVRLGSFDDNWMAVAQEALKGRIAQYAEEDIQFNLMAVVDDPLVKAEQRLEGIEAQLKEKLGEQFKDEEGITNTRVEDLESMPDEKDVVEALRAEREELLKLIDELKREEREEMIKVRNRRHDFEGFVRIWLRVLAENGTLGELVRWR